MKVLVLAATAVMIATQTFAGSYETRCKIERVPYQDTVKGGNPQDLIGGAIIGGLLGKVATDDNAGAAVGAIIGGAIANENSTTTVTKYRDVETCTNVYVPAKITNTKTLEGIIEDLNAGRNVSRELVMDVQFTIGVGYDGVWGPKSRGAAEEFLASLAPAPAPAPEPSQSQTLFSLVVNGVVIVSSPDVTAIDEIKKALAEAGIESKIFVDLQK